MGLGKVPTTLVTNYYTIHTSDPVELEARAREIYCTFCYTRDRDLVNTQVKFSERYHGKEGAKKVLYLVKQMEKGELI